MGRCLCTTLLQTTTLESLKELKEREKMDYDKPYKTKELPELPDNAKIWVTLSVEPVRVVTSAEHPPAYTVEKLSGWDWRRPPSDL